MLFSLSSHEPFDVPNYKKKGNPYLNSISYTDSCLGVMIDRLKTSDKWKNTLVILTADHGTIRPDNAPLYHSSNFKIPLVITGGVVTEDTIVANVVSQADIAATISKYVLGENKFDQSPLFTPSGRAFYSYHDGISYVSDSCTQHYDLGMKQYIGEPCSQPFEKAYYQKNNQNFFNPIK